MTGEVAYSKKHTEFKVILNKKCQSNRLVIGDQFTSRTKTKYQPRVNPSNVNHYSFCHHLECDIIIMTVF